VSAPLAPPASPARNPVKATFAGHSNTGAVRHHNEDKLRAYPKLDLYIVADGMGGHNAGEIASALAAVSVENYVRAARHQTPSPEGAQDARPLSDAARCLVGAVRKANADVYEIAKKYPEHKGMGTTLVALQLARNLAEVNIAHVGDSRCYRIRGGQIELMTRDHTLRNDAIAWKPNITQAELEMLPGNVISRAIGRRPTVEIDIRSELAVPGDVYLLCSDGLSGMVDDATILRCVLNGADLQYACDDLVAVANQAGGKDNVTVIAVMIEPA
jgi:protein phosphatase